MFRFWKHRGRIEPSQPLKTTAGKAGDKPPRTPAERRRLADTDGTLRRMRQQVEDNRLL
jgi:hypothetical protein